MFCETIMKTETAPQPAAHNRQSLGSVLRNPLVVFGLVLLAGDGPLVVAYSMTKNDSAQSWVVLAALILFVFGMGTVFSYIVIRRPRHLFAPQEIPVAAFGKRIYSEENSEDAERMRVLAEQHASTAEENRILKAELECWNLFRRELPKWLREGKSGMFVAITPGEIVALDSDYWTVYQALKEKGPEVFGIVDRIQELPAGSVPAGYYYYYYFGHRRQSGVPSLRVALMSAPSGQNLAPVRRTEIEMTIDTGAAISVISRQMFEQLGGIPALPVEMGMLDGKTVVARRAHVWLEITGCPNLAGRVFGPTEIMVADLPSGTALLGWSFLRDFVLQINGPQSGVALTLP